MNYEEARNYIAHIQGNLGSDYSLKEVTRLAEYMDRPDKKLQIVHIAGTNGKGSVCAYLQAILMAEGKRTGFFTSPHLVSVNERISCGTLRVTDNALFGACSEMGAIYRASSYDLSTGSSKAAD